MTRTGRLLGQKLVELGEEKRPGGLVAREQVVVSREQHEAAPGDQRGQLACGHQIGGGGIRQTPPDEQPGSTPTVHVESTQASYEAALAGGARSVRPPTTVMEGVCVALVEAPGGVLIGFSGPTD
jgi:hypothetical protein